MLLAKVLRSISVWCALCVGRPDVTGELFGYGCLFSNADSIHSTLSRYSSRSPKHQPIDRAHTHLSTRPAKPPALSPTFRISISTLSDLSFPCASPPHSQAAHIQPNPKRDRVRLSCRCSAAEAENLVHVDEYVLLVLVVDNVVLELLKAACDLINEASFTLQVLEVLLLLISLLLR